MKTRCMPTDSEGKYVCSTTTAIQILSCPGNPNLSSEFHETRVVVLVSYLTSPPRKEKRCERRRTTVKWFSQLGITLLEFHQRSVSFA